MEPVVTAGERVEEVIRHLEVLALVVERRIDVTGQQQSLVQRCCSIADALAGGGACHEVRVYVLPPDKAATSQAPQRSRAQRYDVGMHVGIKGELAIPAVHLQSMEIARALRTAESQRGHVLSYVEPL